jgi:hypothetical protein
MSRRPLLAALALAAIGVAVYLSGARTGSRRGEHGNKSSWSGGCSRGTAPAEQASASEREAASAPDKTTRDAERRARMRERLRERLGDRYPKKIAQRKRAPTPEPPAQGTQPAAPPSPAATSDAPKIEPKYIQERVRQDFFPLARECYAEVLKRKPGLAGKVVLEFTIVGDEKIGGIVEDSIVGEDSTLVDDEFETCMSESMMAMAFPPPKGGGTVTVTYPLVFSPRDDGDGGPPPDAGASDAGG